MSKPVKITSISTGLTQNGSIVFGLGDDGRVYMWTANEGGKWLPNWNVEAPAVEGNPDPAPRKQPAKTTIAKKAAAKRKAGR